MRSCHTTLFLGALIAVSACGAEGGDARNARVAEAGHCVPDSLVVAGRDTITEASQRAAYSAVLDSLENLYGNTVLYLDPRVETVGQGKEFTRLHTDAVRDHLLGSGRFSDLCQAGDDSRCEVEQPGVNVRFSSILKPRGGDSLLVDVTEQTVRPMSDSADWLFWATWQRFWLERRGHCWIVKRTEMKGLV